jgi:hypothetical protein
MFGVVGEISVDIASDDSPLVLREVTPAPEI